MIVNQQFGNGVVAFARFRPVTTGVGLGAGLFIQNVSTTVVRQIGYSFGDVATTPQANPSTAAILSRIVAFKGIYTGDATQFSATTYLDNFEVIYDGFINDFGPGVVNLAEDENELATTEGVTILLAKPKLTAIGGATITGALVVGKLYVNAGNAGGRGSSPRFAHASTSVRTTQVVGRRTGPNI